MMRMARTGAVAGILVAASGLGAAASAQTPETDPPAAIEITANIGVVSDYRFRGVSYSDRDPAIQGGIDVAHESGFFVGAWGSSTDYAGANVEIDLYGGYAGQLAGLDYSVTALGYFYPGGTDANYYEMKGAIGKTIGPAMVEAQLWWVPDQHNYPGDNIYITALTEIGIPGTPLTVSASIGRETSDFDKKWDWSAGVAYRYRAFTASIAYVDTDYAGVNEAGRHARAGVVVSLLAEF